MNKKYVAEKMGKLISKRGFDIGKFKDEGDSISFFFNNNFSCTIFETNVEFCLCRKIKHSIEIDKLFVIINNMNTRLSSTKVYLRVTDNELYMFILSNADFIGAKDKPSDEEIETIFKKHYAITFILDEYAEKLVDFFE